MKKEELEKYIGELSPELQEKIRECKTMEEFNTLLAENDVELSDDVLEAVAGGCGTTKGYKFVMLTTIITSLFGIINPVMSKIFMDRLLTGINRDWLYPFIGVMTALALVQIIVEWHKPYTV